MKTTLYFTLSFLLCLSSTMLFGKQITLQEATELARNAIRQNSLTAATTNLQDARIVSHFAKKQGNQVAYYAFNFQPKGFVIIAADDRYHPVLAFSNESHLDLDNPITNIGVIGTLSTHAQRIEYIQKYNLKATPTVQKEWRQLRSGKQTTASRNTIIVGPLTTTKWNQDEFYNDQCPANERTAEEGPAGRTYCGCLPVAMAQLIKFHNFPAQGNGSNQYEDGEFGLLEGDFCNTTYNWDNMPDVLTAPNDDVAQLIYQMGVSTNTAYSTSYTSTFFSYVRDAYVNYFGYDNAARWFYDADFTGFAKVAKQDLDRGLPLLLTGSTSDGSSAHAWVADGYGSFDESGTADYFHFNFGWGGSNNGWYMDTGATWRPTEGQEEAELYDITFYWERYVLYNLYPADSPCQAPPTNDVYANGMNDNNTYLYLSNTLLDQEINFRYREEGTDQWTVTDVTSNYFQFINNLKPGTTYEFQARRRCCSDDWSDYSAMRTFSTTGQSPTPEPPSDDDCPPLLADQLYAGGITETFAYIYTTKPYGNVNNIFRYRAVGATDWIGLATNTNHFRSLTDLSSGQTYEFQVNHECSPGVWSGYSDTQSFTTEGLITCTAVFFADTDGDGFGDPNNTISGCSPPAGYVLNADDCDDTNASIPTTPGTACEGGTIDTDGCTCIINNDDNNNGNDDVNPDCPGIDAARLYVSSISQSALYVYTPQPYGATNNQFRYRPVGSSEWTYTDISTLYYRYLRGLNAGTTYEYQVRQECEENGWSAYSDSYEFTTTSSFQTDDSSTSPISYATYRQLSNTNNSLTVELFPNPAVDELWLQFERPISEEAILMIYSVQGTLVKTNILAEVTEQVQLNVSDLTAGLYLLQYQTASNEVRTMRFVKK